MRPYILAENNWKNVKDTDFELAVLPWGATEAHNYHLPYAADNIEAECLAAESARIAWENGAKVVVLPTVPFGVNTGQSDIKLDMNIYPSTQLILLSDIAESLHRHGIRKLVIFNSHGGNDFRTLAREVGAKYPDMYICVCDWFKWPSKRFFFDNPGDHADEMETSLLMYLTPDLVRPLSEAGDGKEKKHRIEEMREGWFWAERRWSQITADTGAGNPKKASEDKGAGFFRAVTESIAAVFVKLAACDTSDLYE